MKKSLRISAFLVASAFVLSCFVGCGFKSSKVITDNSKSEAISSGVQAIATGWGSSFVLKTDGSLWAWGDNTYGTLGDETVHIFSIPKYSASSFSNTINNSSK